MMSRIRLFLTGLGLAVFVLSCSFWSLGPPPYLITSIVVLNGADDVQNIARLQIEIMNRTEKGISSLELQFEVVDTEGAPRPGEGNNKVKTVFQEDIFPGEIRVIEVLLDSLFSFAPLGNLAVDRFLISKVLYNDGTTWLGGGAADVIGFSDVEVREL